MYTTFRQFRYYRLHVQECFAQGHAKYSQNYYTNCAERHKIITSLSGIRSLRIYSERATSSKQSLLNNIVSTTFPVNLLGYTRQIDVKHTGLVSFGHRNELFVE